METVRDTLYVYLLDLQSEEDGSIICAKLNSISEIQNIFSDVANTRLRIIVKEGTNPTGIIVDRLKDLGFYVPIETSTIPVFEMSCAACAISVESILNSLPEVLNASVSYARS